MVGFLIGDVLWINVNGNSGCEKSLFVFVGRLEFFCNFASNWLGYANYVFFLFAFLLLYFTQKTANFQIVTGTIGTRTPTL